MPIYKTEDEVRDYSKEVLGFNDDEKFVLQGTGQITTFNQLGFKGNNNKPDGWYFPDDLGNVAIILETKAHLVDISAQKWVDELLKNVAIAKTKYSKVVGILYNGEDIRVFKGEKEYKEAALTLQHKSYYLSLYTNEKIDKQRIFNLTKKINDCLHNKFGIKNLYHRMIFTACALVAKRYNALLAEGMDFATLKTSILGKLESRLEEDKKKNAKLNLLTEIYQEIKYNSTSNQEAINNFIDYVTQISECVNSDNWNGEDVMGIFFNEFNRYKKKSESGQVFTPDHITSFMYRLIDVNSQDKVLDAACGSGAFLVKSMCNMIKEVGGANTKEASDIQAEQLFGIEFDREIYALACANMLIHKDGKTNITQMDSRTKEASDWIKSKNITKVLMNPPYERKYGCLDIVSNVLESVPTGTTCAFILPDKKLEKDNTDKKFGNKLLKKHRLRTIVKLPENLFFGVGITTSIFIFESGKPQDNKKIIGYYIEEDGLETVKNQGRQDIRDKWQEKENYWIDAIHNGEDTKYKTRQIIDPQEHLSYQMPEKPFEIHHSDFVKTMMDYELYLREIDVKTFGERLLQNVMYTSVVTEKEKDILISIKK
ncbi:MAG: N-6 DNA methylase [Prevotellaceae bacterium]|nr:N-6 DNA methylase [Prevotellaceae bacterium]